MAYALSLEDTETCAADVLTHLSKHTPVWRDHVLECVVGDGKLGPRVLELSGLTSADLGRCIEILLCWYHLGLYHERERGSCNDYQEAVTVRRRLQNATTEDRFNRIVKDELTGLCKPCQDWLYRCIIDRKERTCLVFIKVFNAGVHSNQQESSNRPFNNFYGTVPSSEDQLIARSTNFERHQERREQANWADAQYVSLSASATSFTRLYSKYCASLIQIEIDQVPHYRCVIGADGSPQITRGSMGSDVQYPSRTLEKVNGVWICKCPTKITVQILCRHEAVYLFSVGALATILSSRLHETYMASFWRIPQRGPETPLLDFKFIGDHARLQMKPEEVTYDDSTDAMGDVEVDMDYPVASEPNTTTTQRDPNPMQGLLPEARRKKLEEQAKETVRM